jgi:hypothetical protein
MGGVAWARGKKIAPNRRGFHGEIPGLAVFVSTSLGGMIGGVTCQRQEEGEIGTGSGKG